MIKIASKVVTKLIEITTITNMKTATSNDVINTIINSLKATKDNLNKQLRNFTDSEDKREIIEQLMGVDEVLIVFECFAIKN